MAQQVVVHAGISWQPRPLVADATCVRPRRGMAIQLPATLSPRPALLPNSLPRHQPLPRVRYLQPRRQYSVVRSAAVSQPSPSAGKAASAELKPDPILVLGSTGGVGQVLVSTLVDRGYRVKAVVRDMAKAEACFGHDHDDKLQLVLADTRHRDTLSPDLFQGIKSIICCTGTTAYPSKRWEDGENKPEHTDFVGIKNLVGATPEGIHRFVLVSSVGVDRYNTFPYNMLNLFGVLKWKKEGEKVLQASGLPYTVIRAARLTDGPYTSYDINTLIKGVSGNRQAVTVGQGDNLKGECSRLAVAEACIQSLHLDCTLNEVYEVTSTKGEGPGSNTESWGQLFTKAHSAPT